MINRARLTQCLPWQSLNESTVDPDRHAIASLITDWLDRAPINTQGKVQRRKPTELTESLEDARATLKTLQRHLRAAGLDNQKLFIFDAAGGVHEAVYQELLTRIDQSLALKTPAPHPAANENATQWQRLIMRGIFWNLQESRLVRWDQISNRDQAEFLSAVLIEFSKAAGLPAESWTAERWRKSRDDFFSLTATGYRATETV